MAPCSLRSFHLAFVFEGVFHLWSQTTLILLACCCYGEAQAHAYLVCSESYAHLHNFTSDTSVLLVCGIFDGPNKKCASCVMRGETVIHFMTLSFSFLQQRTQSSYRGGGHPILDGTRVPQRKGVLRKGRRVFLRHHSCRDLGTDSSRS